MPSRKPDRPKVIIEWRDGPATPAYDRLMRYVIRRAFNVPEGKKESSSESAR